MITSYEVGALFNLDPGDSISVLNELASQFGRVDELANTLKENLATLGRDSLGGLRTGLERISEVITGLDTKAKALGDTLMGAADVAGAAFTRAASQADTVAAAYERATASVRGFAEAAGNASMAGGAGGGLVPVERQRGNYGDPESGPTINAGGRGQGLLEGPDASFFEGGLAGAGMGGGGGRRGGRGGRRGGGGSGGHGLLHGILPLAEVAGGYEAEKSAMEEDLAIRQALVGMNVNPDSPEGQADFARMRSLAYGSAKGTIFSESKASMAMPEAAPVLGFSGKEGIEKFEQTFPVALRLGELSQMRHKGSLGPEAVAGEEFAHMTDQYNPEGLTKELDLINAIAKRADTSIARQQSIMKYGMPVAIAAGIAPNTAAAEMGASEQILGATSTVGTGYSQMLLSVLKSGGGINSHLEKSTRHAAKHAEHEFENALKLKPEELKDYKEHSKGSKHDEAMTAFGFSDANVAAAVKAGNLDQMIETHVQAYSKAHPDKAFAELINLMGVRGARYTEHYMAPDAMEREQRYVSGVTGAMSVKGEQDTLSHSPMQQFEQMLANLSNIGNTLATATLPTFNSALTSINVGLLHLNDFLKEHHGAAEAGGYAVAGGVGLALMGGGKRALGAIWNLGKAGAETIGGAGRAGAAVAGSEVAGALGPLGLVGVTAMGIEKGWSTGVDWATDKVFGKGTAAAQHKMEAADNAYVMHMLNLGPGPRAAAAAPTTAAPPLSPAAAAAAAAGRNTDHAKPAAPITVNLGGITMNGVADEHTFKGLLAKLTEAIKGALSHASGAGMGTESSPYVFGGT